MRYFRIGTGMPARGLTEEAHPTREESVVTLLTDRRHALQYALINLAVTEYWANERRVYQHRQTNQTNRR